MKISTLNLPMLHPSTAKAPRPMVAVRLLVIAMLLVLAAPLAGDPLPPPEDVAAAPADAVKASSGLATKLLEAGQGSEHPAADDWVEFHYTGWSTDGTMFDSSVLRARPARFRLNRVIAGWAEGLQLMVEGEKRRLWVPEDLAYKGRAGSPHGMLVFDIELLDIEKPPEEPKVPKDIAGPPDGAERADSGLASRVLRAGSGDRRPGPTEWVKVHYSGWTTDGTLFDSSAHRGQAAVFGLEQVIPGWAEGLQLMVEGEKRRLWIPEELAYKGRPNRPAGMLVFDVELISIQN